MIAGVPFEVEAPPTIADLQAEVERLKDQLHAASQRAGERAIELEAVRAELERRAHRHDRLEALRARADALRAEREQTALTRAEIEREREELEERRAALETTERAHAEREAALQRAEHMWERVLEERVAQLDRREQTLRAAEEQAQEEAHTSIATEGSVFRSGLSSLEPRPVPARSH
jgi:DNA repair exonuclease SbcCD ATPase subunit